MIAATGTIVLASAAFAVIPTATPMAPSAKEPAATHCQGPKTISIPLTNSSFEADTVAEGETASAHAGWMKFGWTGNAVTWHPTAQSFCDEGDCLPPPASGRQCLWLTGGPNIYQPLFDVAIEANKTYTLTASIGSPRDRDFGKFAIVLASPSGEIVSTSDATAVVNRSGRFYDVSTSFHTGPNGRTDLVGKMVIVNLNGDKAAIDYVRFTSTE